jgi:hypothetical protein
MKTACSDCGASLTEPDTCQSIFDSFLVLEFSDPAYGAVHFLTVACYMIQHGRYSDAALAWIEKMLRAYLDEGLTSDQLRRQAAQDASQQARAWKVMRQPGERPLPKIAWAMTIADVAARNHAAASYCEAVRKWVRTTLAQMAG